MSPALLINYPVIMKNDLKDTFAAFWYIEL